MPIQLTAPIFLSGTIDLPSSKSICNRALIINSLSESPYPITNVSSCDDTFVTINALADLHSGSVLNIGAAGTAMRFLTAYLSVTPGTHLLTGSERMKNRPIALLVDALRTIGANIAYPEKEGYPPLLIEGQPLNGGSISLDGGISSQYISALLMIAPLFKEGLKLTLTGNIISKPYIDMTLSIMKMYGSDATWSDSKTISIPHQVYKPTPFSVESDWSAASYWYQMVALSKQGSIQLLGLFPTSNQGDSEVSAIFKQLGVQTIFNELGAFLTKIEIQTKRLQLNLINQPDLAQTIVVTCCMLQIPFEIKGLQSLKIKETDRITALITELKKIGYLLSEQENSCLTWNGDQIEPLLNPIIDTYEDHRMAMAFSPCAFCLDSILINDPEVVSKSYPTYWEDLKKVGFVIQ